MSGCIVTQKHFISHSIKRMVNDANFTVPNKDKCQKIVRLSGIIIQICPLALCAILIRYDFGPPLCGGVRCDKMKRYMCLETPFKAAPHWGSHAGCQLVRWDIFYSP